MRFERSIKEDIITVYLKSKTFEHLSANKIQKILKGGVFGLRRKILLKILRHIRGSDGYDEENAIILNTPDKYLSDFQREEKYCLLLDKMREESKRRGEIEKRKIAKEFMRTDKYEEDRVLENSEKVEDAWNELSKYMRNEVIEYEK